MEGSDKDEYATTWAADSNNNNSTRIGCSINNLITEDNSGCIKTPLATKNTLLIGITAGHMAVISLNGTTTSASQTQNPAMYIRRQGKTCAVEAQEHYTKLSGRTPDGEGRITE